MGLISKETIKNMWQYYREVEASQKLLHDIKEVQENDHFDEYEGKLENVFGQRRDFELGVPSGKSGHRIFNVNVGLAKSVIEAHKAKMEAKLIESNEQARIELNS